MFLETPPSVKTRGKYLLPPRPTFEVPNWNLQTKNKRNWLCYSPRNFSYYSIHALSLDRAREFWKKHGRSEKWIQQRMTGQETRNKLTD